MHDELIAAGHSVEQIRDYIRADSLGYLSLEGMLKAADKSSNEVCTACWTEEHPVALPIGEGEQLGLFDKTNR